jgi:hypothetical protein
MSAVAKLIEDMIAAGVSADLVGRTAALLAEREAVLVPDEQAERRRAKDRERKRLRNSADSAEFQTSPAAPKDVEPKLPTVENNQSPTTPLKPPAARRFDDWPEDFAEQLWAVFPRRTDKKVGMEALAKLHRMDRVAWADLMRGVGALDDCDPQFVPTLARWIKNERWKDERPSPGRAPPSRQAKRNTALDDLNFEADRFFSNVQQFPRIAG